jgi:hypothetical protein
MGVTVLAEVLDMSAWLYDTLSFKKMTVLLSERIAP